MAQLDKPFPEAIRGISTVAGRYVIGDQPMHPGINLFACRLRDISVDELNLAAPVIPEVGEHVSASFGPFGTIKGLVDHHTAEGFVVHILLDKEERHELASKLERYRTRPWTGPRERRADHRFMPGEPRSVIARPDGWAHPCLIVDYSVSGAAISTAYHPSIGQVVTVGQVTAEVVRLFDVGFAVRFFEKQSLDEIETLLEAPREWRSAAFGKETEWLHDRNEAIEAYGADG